MIQIDMHMPKNCFNCPACNEYLTCAIPINGRKWGENDVHDFSESRPEWCPMKEQEAVEPKWFIDAHNPAGAFRCGSCGERIIEKNIDFYCSKCGQAVKWDADGTA